MPRMASPHLAHILLIAGVAGAMLRIIIDPDSKKNAKRGYLPIDYYVFNTLVGAAAGLALLYLDAGSTELGLALIASMSGYGLSDIVDSLWYLGWRSWK